MPRDHFGGVRIRHRIEQLVRNTVAGKKALQTNDAGRIRRIDQHWTPGTAPDQVDAAKDERTHDTLAEIGFGNQKGAQPLRRNQQRVDVAPRVAIDQRDAAGKLTQLGQKLARPLLNDRRDMTEAVALADRHMAGKDDKHARSDFAGLEQRFAMLVVARLAEPAHPRDFLRRQRRKGLLITRKCARRRRHLICLVSHRSLFRHFTLVSFPRRTRRSRIFPGKPTSYLSGCFSLVSPGATSSELDDEIVKSSRSLACDFLRLRFSRNASFSRSWRKSFASFPD